MMQEKYQDNVVEDRNGGKVQICCTTKMDQPEPFGLVFPVSHPTIDTSFQQNLSDEHARAIWNSSIQFLRAALKTNFDEEKGFNDQNIFEFFMEHKDSICEEMEPIELLNKNQILSVEQKKELDAILQKSIHLKKLNQELYKMFAHEIYDQIAVILYESLCQYRAFKLQTKLSEQFSKFLGPCYNNLDINTLEMKNTPEHYEFKSENEIISKADEAGDQIGATYFINNHLRFLNLKEVNATLNNSNTVRKQFSRFLQTIAQAVYLCVQGCFVNPHELSLTGMLTQELSVSQGTHSEGQEKINHGRKRRNL